MQGLTLPRLSASDPEVAGEGGLDPLRLGVSRKLRRRSGRAFLCFIDMI
jgi:hypothetical protein